MLRNANLLKATDPQATEVFRRRADWTTKNTEQAYWWGPDETTPDHAPDMPALFER